MLRIAAPGITERPPLAVVLGRPVATVEEAIAKDGATLLAPHALDRRRPGVHLGRAAAVDAVRRRRRPRARAGAGRALGVLAERARWAEGRYLAVDLQLVCERNDDKRGGEIDRALDLPVAPSRSLPTPTATSGGTGVLEESVKHTVGVSKDLREGVRLSIEIIANEVVRRRRAQDLEPLPADRGATSWPSSRCGSSTGSCSCSTPRRRPSSACCRSVRRSTTQGYSLDRLRELTLVELATPAARSTAPTSTSRWPCCSGWSTRATTRAAAAERRRRARRRVCSSTRCAPTCSGREATALIDEVGLGNAALQQVLRHLLLSKESSAAATAASSPTPSSASTSSARCTRA